MAVFFIFKTESLNIETDLSDLNPAKLNDNNIEFAKEKLLADINNRFIVLVKANEMSQLSTAIVKLQERLSIHPSLQVLSKDTIQEHYLEALRPYRFNLLSKEQQETLKIEEKDILAAQAQRKLYQLGDGIRLIPFEQDPLGWFSDFLLNRFNEIDNSNSAKPIEESTTNNMIYDSFAVYITHYPSSMAQQSALYKDIRQDIETLQTQLDVDILHSGMFFFAVDSAQSAKGDIQLIAIGSTLGVLVLMLSVFRSLLPLCLSLGSIAIGVGFGVFISTIAFGSIHILTIVFGASLIGIVVDYSLHYFYHHLCEKNIDTRKQKHNNTLVRAMVLSVLTSLIGYGALSLSDLLILKKVALFSCSGLIMAWLGVMVLGPFVSNRPIVARQAFLVMLINKLQNVLGAHPKALVTAGISLAIVGLVFIYTIGLHTNDDPRKFFHVSSSLLTQEQEVANLTQVFEPGRFIIVKGKTNQEVYASLTALYEAMGDKRGQLSSVLDWLSSADEQQTNYDLQQKLYADGGVVELFYERLGLGIEYSQSIKQEYLVASASVLEFPELNRELSAFPPLWISHNDHIYSFVLLRKNSDFSHIEKLASNFDNIDYINTLGRAMEALKDKRITGAKLLLLAYVLIGVMLFLYYKRLMVVCLLLIPAVASIITISVLVLIGQAITIFHVMALFLVLGLGMDYIVFAKEMTAQRETTQQAILLSAVTSLLSFGLLAFSSMPVVQAFGSTILIGNSINFIAAISLFNKAVINTKEKHLGV